MTLTAAAVAVLAAAGAGVGQAIHGVEGVVLGAVVGAFGGVIGGYLPAITDRAVRRRREDESAHRAWRSIGELPAGNAGPSPSGFLRPETAVVKFTGREAELDELRSWCEAALPRSVRVIIGVGGVGKTRLALKVAMEWQGTGREWRIIAAGKESQAMAAARGVTSGPVLLIVDYAETRPALEDLLAAVLGDPGRVRVLLLARSLGEWWDRLMEGSPAAIGRMLTEYEPIQLNAPVTATLSDADLAVAAIPFFAQHLGVPAPSDVVFELPSHRVPVLVLHAAALVAVLRSSGMTAPMPQVNVDQAVLTELLEHEARYWRRTAAAVGLRAEGATLKAVVAAAILLGAEDLAQASSVANRAPGLAGESPSGLRLFARWLYGLYPADQEGQLGSVQPDLLAEAHVVAELSPDHDLARSCLRGLTESQAGRALTVLARAWVSHDAAGELLAAAFEHDLATLAIPACKVAVQTNARVAEPLVAALRTVSVPLEVLISIAHAMPFPSVALVAADAVVHSRIVSDLPAETGPQITAEWKFQAAIRLAQIGERDEALHLAEQAARTFEQLAAGNPALHKPDLARSLASLGIRLNDVGRTAEALEAAHAGVEIYRDLAQTDPARYRPNLARSLCNLGIWLAGLSRPGDALPLGQEAADILRKLNLAIPGTYRSELAQALTNLAVTLGALGRSAEALPPAREAVGMYRNLAQDSADQYRPYLAASLSNLSLWLQQTGDTTEALDLIREAAGIYRDLAEGNPRRYRPDFAGVLSNLGVQMSEIDDLDHALPFSQEAVTLLRELAAANRDRYQAALAKALSNHSILLRKAERPAEALHTAREAADIMREVAATKANLHDAELIRCLSNYKDVLLALGSDDEGARIADEIAVISANKPGNS